MWLATKLLYFAACFHFQSGFCCPSTSEKDSTKTDATKGNSTVLTRQAGPSMLFFFDFNNNATPTKTQSCCCPVQMQTNLPRMAELGKQVSRYL